MTEKDKWWCELTGYYPWVQNIIVERRDKVEAERKQLLISLKNAEKAVEEVNEKLAKNDIEFEHLKKLNDDIGTGWLLRKEEAMNVRVTFDANNPNVACFSSDRFEVLQDTKDGLGVVHFDKDGVTPLYMDRKARVFIAGQHRGRDYSESVLDSYNSKFVEPKDDLRGWKVPLQADHQPRSCNNTIGHPRKM